VVGDVTVSHRTQNESGSLFRKKVLQPKRDVGRPRLSLIAESESVVTI
jgi:hypothetical protein